ncbi:hypothetical protein ALC60_14405, partial [Trachymyrmex zeteki]
RSRGRRADLDLSRPCRPSSSRAASNSRCPAGAMAGSETSRAEIRERPSAIVRIAYHVLTIPTDGEFSAIRHNTTDLRVSETPTANYYNFRVDVTEIVCGIA